MASSIAEPMPQTVEAYKALAQRDLELIMEMKAEISKLKERNNRLHQKNRSLRDILIKKIMKKNKAGLDYLASR